MTNPTDPQTILGCCMIDHNDPACGHYKNNSDSCDAGILDICTTDPTYATCECIKSNIPYPHCFDKVCMSMGYKNNKMKNQTCPAELPCHTVPYISSDEVDNIIDGAITPKCRYELLNKKISDLAGLLDSNNKGATSTTIEGIDMIILFIGFIIYVSSVIVTKKIFIKYDDKYKKVKSKKQKMKSKK